ncbi:hypothetical protein Tco_0413002 [Tanacetum coccineum]
MFEFKQTNQFAKAVSLIPEIVDKYIAFKLKDVIDSNMKAIIKEQVKTQFSKIMPKVEKYVRESLGAEVLVRSTNQPQTSYTVAASLLEFELKKILIDKIEENKSINISDIQNNLYNALVKLYNSDKDIISSYGKSAQIEEHGQKVDDVEEQSHQEFNTGNDDATPIREVQNMNERTQSLFNKFMANPIDFTVFIMNRLKIENLTQDVLTGPTYDLMKGTCKSVVELEYHLEEVFKATNDQLDWHNPEGRPHLEEIIVRRHDDQLYKFREGDFKRLHRQDIEDMLLLLVQGKLTNLNLDEWYALNVALRIYTRRIVIQERVEDLQLGVKSYQKKINLSRPESYLLDLRKITPYTAYPDI